MALFHSLLWLGSIPLCVCGVCACVCACGVCVYVVCMCVCVCGCVCVCVIFFIHSFVDGHLGCSHVLATVYSAAMNTGVHVSFSNMVFSGYMPSSGIAGLHGSFIPSFCF